MTAAPRATSSARSTPRAAKPSGWLYVLLGLIVLIGFGRAWDHEFINWDDELLIYANGHLNPPTLHGLAWHWAHPHYHLYVPVIYTAWWCLANLAHLDTPDPLGASLNPAVFHSANILVHLLAVWVVYQILLRLIGKPWPAFAGAALFAIHPLQVEAVAWATGMKDVLSGLLSFVAIWQYLEFAYADEPRGRRRHYILASIAFAFALLAKPSAVMVPVVVAVLDVLIVRRSIKQCAMALWPWLAAAAVMTVVASRVQPPNPMLGGPLWARPLIAADALYFYISKLFFPLHLGIDYGRTPANVLRQHWLYYTWLVPAALAAIIVWARKPMLTAASLVFLLSVVPVLGLVAFFFQYYSTVTDRYVYVAMLGPALALAWAVSLRRSLNVFVATMAVLLALLVLTIIQVGYWADSDTLYAHALEVNPSSFVAENNLGQIREHEGKLDDAIALYRGAIEADPGQPKPYSNLAIALAKAGKRAEAIHVIYEMLDLEPTLPAGLRTLDVPQTHDLLGQLFMKEKQYPRAVDEFQKAVELKPDDAQYRRDLEDAKKNAPELAPSTAPLNTNPLPQ